MRGLTPLRLHEKRGELLVPVDLAEATLTRIAAIVHDLDLNEGRFGASEAPTVGVVVEGLRLTHADDHHLLAAGMALFEALYRAFAQADLSCGPRPVAKRKANKPPGCRRRM